MPPSFFSCLVSHTKSPYCGTCDVPVKTSRYCNKCPITVAAVQAYSNNRSARPGYPLLPETRNPALLTVESRVAVAMMSGRSIGIPFCFLKIARGGVALQCGGPEHHSLEYIALRITYEYHSSLASSLEFPATSSVVMKRGWRHSDARPPRACSRPGPYGTVGRSVSSLAPLPPVGCHGFSNWAFFSALLIIYPLDNIPCMQCMHSSKLPP
jgi:hypothetical protein